MWNIRVLILFLIDKCIDYKIYLFVFLVVSLCRGFKDGIGFKGNIIFLFLVVIRVKVEVD